MITSFTLQSRDTTLYWRGVYPGSTEVQIPVTSSKAGVTRRWVPGTRDIIITAPADAAVKTRVASADTQWRQVFLYHAGDGSIEQLTFDPVNKYWAFMWPAPEFNNQMVFAVMVGGDAAAIERCRPLFAVMGQQIFVTGPLGSGHALKALNNLVSAAGLVAARPGPRLSLSGGGFRRTGAGDSDVTAANFMRQSKMVEKVRKGVAQCA